MATDNILIKIFPRAKEEFCKDLNPGLDINKITKLEENTETKLKDQIEKRKVLAETKIDQMTRDANNVIQSYISSTAISATIKIIKQKLNNKEKQKLIDKSIKELESALKN